MRRRDDPEPEMPPSPVAEAEGTERRTRSTPTRERLRDNNCGARGLVSLKRQQRGIRAHVSAGATHRQEPRPAFNYGSTDIRTVPPNTYATTEQTANRARIAPHLFASANATGALPIVQLTKGNPLSQAS